MNKSRVAENITELVGQTPMLHLRRIAPDGAADIFAKLEYLNPGGSVKDRAAIGMIQRAEQEGRLKPGATIQVKVMKALGAEVLRTPDADGMQGAIKKVKELSATIPGSFTALQFENPSNPDFHHQTTAAEIYEQMEGRVDAIVVGIGTGGTFSGVARFMKEKNPAIHCVAVETEGSVLQGGKPGPHKVEGIGSSFVPKTFDRSVCDEIIMVTDKDAFATVAMMARKEGVLGASSAGANVFAAIEVARKLGKGKRVVTIIPDSAERYMSKNIFEGGI